MGFIYYNPNPANKSVGDCVIRALSVVLNDSWENIYADLTMQGRFMYDMPNANNVWGEYLKLNGFKRRTDQESMQYGYGMMPNARMNRYDYGYGYGYGDPGYSEERGRSPVTGRYISRGMSGRGGNNNGGGGYSGHSIEDRMIASLEQQMDQAQSDYERNMIEEEINHIRMKSQGK